MFKNFLTRSSFAAWVALIVLLFSLTLVWGDKPSISAGAFWLLACLGPPVLLVWRPPTQTVAELLYDANHPDKDGRP